MYTKGQKLFKGFLFHTVNIIEFGIIYLLFIAAEILSYHKVSLCTDVPPPSGKIGRGDVCESPMIIMFPFPENVGDSL